MMSEELYTYRPQQGQAFTTNGCAPSVAGVSLSVCSNRRQARIKSAAKRISSSGMPILQFEITSSNVVILNSGARKRFPGTIT